MKQYNPVSLMRLREGTPVGHCTLGSNGFAPAGRRGPTPRGMLCVVQSTDPALPAPEDSLKPITLLLSGSRGQSLVRVL